MLLPVLLGQCGRSPLWAAASCGHAEVVRSLVDSGASIDLAEKVGGQGMNQHVSRYKPDTTLRCNFISKGGLS